MKRITLLFTAAAVIIGLSGCELLTNQQNLFAGLEPDLTTKYSASVTGGSLLDNLSADSDSSSFYEDLSANPTVADEIVANLDAIIDDTSGTYTDEQVEDAALYKADILLNTTASGEVVDSLIDALLDSSSAGSSETALLDAVMAPVNDLITSGDSTGFTSFMTTMLDLASTYDALAEANYATGSTLSADVAQAAAVSLVIEAVVSAIVVTDTNANGVQDEQITALYDTLVALNSGDTSASLDLTGFNLADDLLADDASLGGSSSLEVLLSAAGLDNLTTLISQMGA